MAASFIWKSRQMGLGFRLNDMITGIGRMSICAPPLGCLYDVPAIGNRKCTRSDGF